MNLWKGFPGIDACQYVQLFSFIGYSCFSVILYAENEFRFLLSEGKRRLFEPHNAPDQTARARTFIFLRGTSCGDLNRTTEAIFVLQLRSALELSLE